MTWGHGVTLAFGCFVVYILSFVYRSFQHDIDLVSEDYYAQEVVYQDRIDEAKNAAAWSEPINITGGNEGVSIRFEKLPETARLTGTVNLFRPSDKRLDLELPLALDKDGAMLIPTEKVVGGRYEVQLKWNDGQRSYYTSKYLYLP